MQESKYNPKLLLLAPPGIIQNYLLNNYRLTDEYRQLYGEYIISKMPDGQQVKKALEEITKFKKLSAPAELDEYRSLVIDLIYSRHVLNFLHWEFFAYGLEDKTIDERLEFMPQIGRKTYTRVFNQSREDNLALSNKFTAYLTLKPFYKRDVVICSDDNPSNRKRFMEFCEKHPRFFAKPAWGSLGKGARVIDSSEYADKEELFNELSSEKKGTVCEELIEQHESFEVIHPQSVNSLRIATFLSENGTAKIICAYLRAGTGDTVVDNGGAGGLMAAVDVKTGIVLTDAATENNETYATHPDTGFVFKGFQIPQWDELEKLAHEVAQAMSAIRLIGWDIALSKDKGWQLIEGNCQAQINAVQIPLKQGMRKQYEADIDWENTVLSQIAKFK